MQEKYNVTGMTSVTTESPVQKISVKQTTIIINNGAVKFE